jgi:glycosyltransferase involved in cell wall biosynthesis
LDDPKLHIVKVCSSPSWGGMEMISVQIGKELRNRGHRVTFITGEQSAVANALKGTGLSVLQRPGRGYVDPLSVVWFQKWMNSETVDVIHTHYSKDLWFLVPALVHKYADVPLVLTKHIGTMKPKEDFLHRRLYRRVDAIIGISQLITDNVIHTHPVEKSKVICMPNGVDRRVFHPGNVNRLQVRTNLKIPANATVIGIAGRLCWWKGYREFLDMAAVLLKERTDVWFLAVGGPTKGEEQEMKEIHDYARSIDPDDKICFTGFQEKVAPFLSAMDLFVYPAYAEAFGLVLIEAMAMGLPVVSTDCDGVPEIVIPEDTGLLVPARSSQAIVDAVKHLLKHPHLMRKYGLNGKKRIQKLFDFEKMITRTDRLYRDLIKKRKRI